MKHSTIKIIRLAISNFCDLKCKHCYSAKLEREELLEMEKNQLSIEEIKDFLTILINDFGLEKVDITGGETLNHLVWPRTKEILKFAIENRLEIQLNTSGSGDIEVKEIKEVIGDYEKFTLHVSLDGVDEEKVDWFRGKKGAFKSAIQTFKDAVASNLFVRSRFTVTKDNYNDIEACYDLVTSLGANAFMFKPVNLAGNAQLNKNELSVEEEIVRDIQLKLINKSIDCPTRLDLPAPHFINYDQIPSNANVRVTHCICGVNLLYMAYNGDIYPCTYFSGADNSEDYRIGNIMDKNFNFKEVWLSPETYREFRQALKHECTANKLLSYSENKDKNEKLSQIKRKVC